jgi:hypothetical protein
MRCSQRCEHLLKPSPEIEMISPEPRHLNQEQLARRWNISPRTLERWRWLRQEPKYLKIGGHVVYRLEDVEAYEQQHMHAGVKAAS